MKQQNHYFAFFDVDGTILKTKTTVSFLKYFYSHHHQFLGALFYKKYILGSTIYKILGRNREYLHKRYYKYYKGYHENNVLSLAHPWFKDIENNIKNIYIQSTLQEIKKHKERGAKIILVSGSFLPGLLGLSEKLGVTDIISTQLEITNGTYTGKILHPQTIGIGKVKAIEEFLKKHNTIDPKDCYAYGDHISDLSMLSFVGHPYVIKGDLRLESYANQFGWPILSNS